MNGFLKLCVYCVFVVFSLFVLYMTNRLYKLEGDKSWSFSKVLEDKHLESNLAYQGNKNTSGGEKVENSKYDFTFVSQASFNRWSFMLEIMQRWKGPISICYYVTKEEAPEYLKLVSESNLRPNVILDHRIQNDPSFYPVNELRNIAISHVTTSHFYLSDMDVWPSSTTYEALRKLPVRDLENEKLAIIVPAYQIRMIDCTSFEQCVKTYRFLYPHNKQLLRNCLHDHRCSQFRPREFLHDYYPNDWFYTSRSLIPVTCFKSDTQEPYIVVKKIPDLPKFNESFVNYSYNKVQWIENLRWVGYSFSVLVDGYSVDIPHPESAYRKQFFKELKQTRIFPMIDVYYSFLDTLNKTVPNHEVIKMCPKAHINSRRIYFSSDFKKKSK